MSGHPQKTRFYVETVTKCDILTTTNALLSLVKEIEESAWALRKDPSLPHRRIPADLRQSGQATNVLKIVRPFSASGTSSLFSQRNPVCISVPGLRIARDVRGGDPPILVHTRC